MIVSNKKAAVHRIARVYQEQRSGVRARKPQNSLSFNDEVRLSAEGKEMQILLQKLQETPAIRPQAEEIKVALEQGTYRVSPHQVAAGILATRDRG